MIWVVAALAVLIGITLGALIPGTLSAGPTGPGAHDMQGNLHGARQDGGSR
jgi:uncharacterized membrane-anchored protein YhcB (DUF1043 family)